MLVELLGMDSGDVTTKLKQCCGAHVKLSWLCQVYKEYKKNIVYQLRLICCTLLNAQYLLRKVQHLLVSYLSLFNNMWWLHMGSSC